MSADSPSCCSRSREKCIPSTARSEMSEIAAAVVGTKTAEHAADTPDSRESRSPEMPSVLGRTRTAGEMRSLEGEVETASATECLNATM